MMNDVVLRLQRVIDELKAGFVVCEACGEQEDTATLDCVPELEAIAAVLAAQSEEAEGVSNARLMKTLAELARRAPLRTLHTICETQRQVSTVKLERYLEPVGDTLAGYAFTLRSDFDKLSAALSAVTAERDQLRAEVEALRKAFGDCVNSLHAEMLQKYGGQLPEDMHPVTRRDYDRDMEEIAEYRAAMTAKEA